MVAKWKQGYVKNLAEDISSAKVIGLVNITGIPSKQLQVMRKKLRGKARLTITKNNLIRRALEKAKVKELEPYIDGPTGLVFSDLDPFRLEMLLSQGKTKAKAKAGNISPMDIVIPAGDTPFPPGPIIGELQQAGIKAKIEGGKIVVTRDSKIVSEGEVITQKLANVLGRLELEPFEIGLTLNAAFDGDLVYSNDVLSINPDETLAKLVNAHTSSINLAHKARIYNGETITSFLSEAFVKASALAFNAEIITKGNIGQFISKANTQAQSLSSRIPQSVQEDTVKEYASEEKASEDKLAEDKQEDAKDEEPNVSTDDKKSDKEASVEQNTDKN